jgi:cysteine desulfurase
MDANATTPLLPEVMEAMRPYWMEHFGNASSIHLHGQQARTGVDQARDTMAEFFNCHPAEVVFNSGGTEGDNTALFGLLHPGDHCITTSIEHSAILQAANRMALRGVETTFVAPQPSGLIDPMDILRAIRPQTRLISVMLANNETGVLQPVEEIGKIANDTGVFFHIDAVQGAGKVKFDVRRIGCHLLSISAHKMHGPKGIGAMFVRRGTPVEPLLVGGSHERRQRAGTENVAGIVGLGKAAELAMHSLQDGTIDRLAALRDRLEAGVLALPGTGVNGANVLGGNISGAPGPASGTGECDNPLPRTAYNGAALLNGVSPLSAPEGQRENSPGQAQRSPGRDASTDLAPRGGAAKRSDHSDSCVPRTANTTNIWFDHLEGEALVIALDLKGVAVSGGSACHSGATEPSHVLMAMGLNKTRARASLRFSLLKTATDADVDHVLQVVPQAVERLRALSPVAAGTLG